MPPTPRHSSFYQYEIHSQASPSRDETFWSTLFQHRFLHASHLHRICCGCLTSQQGADLQHPWTISFFESAFVDTSSNDLRRIVSLPLRTPFPCERCFKLSPSLFIGHSMNRTFGHFKGFPTRNLTDPAAALETLFTNGHSRALAQNNSAPS